MQRFSPHLVPLLLILGAVLVVYSGAFGNDFLINWDDPLYVTANPDVQSFTLANLRKIFSTYYVGNYAPVQMLSYMLDYQLWGAEPFGFILTNVLFHGLNGTLFYLLLCRLGMQPVPACLAALIFTVHPVQVESVAWISQRKNVLAMTFFLAAIWQYLSYVRAVAWRWWHFAAANLFFVLALLAKSVVVVLPAVLLVYDFTLRRERVSLPRMVAEKIPFVLLAVGFSYLAIISQDYGVVSDHHGGSLFATAITMLTVYKDYLLILFWPLQLSAVYLVDIKTSIDAEVVLSAILLLATGACLLLCRRESRQPAAFWLSLFALGFLPVSQIVPLLTLMNDRYLYFPMLGFSACLILFLPTVDQSPRAAKVAVVCALTAITLLGAVAWQRTGAWASSLALWQDTVQKQPQSAMAWYQLGHVYFARGDFPPAIANYHKALSLDPGKSEVYYDLGLVYHQNNDLANAIQSYRTYLDLAGSQDLEVVYNLGLLYTRTVQHQAAVNLLEPYARVPSEGTERLLFILAANYYFLGNFSAAWQTYERLGQNDPGSAGVAGFLSLVALRMGDGEASRRLLQQAVAGGFAAADIYLQWARMEAVGQRRDQALQFLATALAVGVKNPAGLYDDPDFAGLRDDAAFRRMIGR